MADELPEAALVPAETPEAPVDRGNGKGKAIADLTMSAYQKASTLVLTKEETAALQADFPDDAFKAGAAGKADLLYLEHAFLRDRLNEVLGLGQWALIPRSRWPEYFKTEKGYDATRIYVEAMLLIRGSLVAEAIGDMVYYPNNPSQNYGDAVEGATTAALRRCCKLFGVGLQAWKKDWCAGWWYRNRECITKQQAEAMEYTLRGVKQDLVKFFAWVCEFEKRPMPEEPGYADLRKINKASLPKINEFLARKQPKEEAKK